MWCVEYSKSQKAFHLDILGEIVRKNLSMFLKGNSNDYQIIGAYPTQEKANEAIKYYRGETL